MDVFTDPDLISSIRKATGEMMIHSHGCSRSTNVVGYLQGYPNPIWYDPDGIDNILSLANVKKLFGVTFDSDKGNAFKVHMGKKVVEFRRVRKVCTSMMSGQVGPCL